MKKLIPLFLSFGIIFSFIPSVQAADSEVPVDMIETVIDDEGTSEDTPENIDYFFSQSEGDDIVVNSLTGYKVSNGAILTLDYESTDTRDASFFNPPDGDSIKKIFRGGIKPGHNQLEIILNETNISRVMENDSITMILGFGDKSSFLNFKVQEIEELPIRDGTIPDSSGSIEFGSEASTNDTLVIHSLQGYRVSNGVVLKLTVWSPDARSLSLFNPPDGDLVMKIYNNKINEGDNSVTIELLDTDVSKLLEGDTVTMRLGFDSKYTFLYFNSEVLVDLPLKEGVIIPSQELNYSTKAMAGDTLTVNSFKAFNNGKGIQFELIVDSPNMRSFSLFNPPNGNKIMKIYKNRIKKGKNKIILNLNHNDVEKIMQSKELTFRLGFESKCTFVYLRTSDLSDLPDKQSGGKK